MHKQEQARQTRKLNPPLPDPPSDPTSAAGALRGRLHPALPVEGATLAPKLTWERRLWGRQIERVAGLDEAGRGAWAGPVVAACVIFKPETYLPEVDDSKKILPAKREKLFDEICETALDFAIASVSVEWIDSVNILQASLMAMCEAVGKLKNPPHYLLIDGNRGLSLPIPQEAIIRGDSLSQSIGAASILAKVTRDRLMREMEKEFPDFCFARHKGYGTELHRSELARYGLKPCHRRSFEPMKSMNITPPLGGSYHPC